MEKLIKNIHASELAKLRKGIKEQKSNRKSITSKENGKKGGRPAKKPSIKHVENNV